MGQAGPPAWPCWWYPPWTSRGWRECKRRASELPGTARLPSPSSSATTYSPSERTSCSSSRHSPPPEWLEKRQETAVELPTAQADLEQDPQADSVPEQEEQETVLAMATNNMLGEGTSKSNNDSDTIPQLDGQVETKSNDLPPEKTHVEKEDEAVIFQMLDNGFAETKTIAPGVNPPAIVIHPELGIGKNPVKTHWHDSFWFEYVFEPSGVQMEMYQVQVESTDDGSRA